MAKIYIIYFTFILTSTLYRHIEVNAQTTPPCAGGILSFCISCQSYGLCPTDPTIPPTMFSCGTAGTACTESGSIATCVDISATPCKCVQNTSSPTYQCDPYDDYTVNACANGIISGVVTCTDPQICTDGACGAIPSTTNPPVTLTSCATGSIVPSKLNCTAYYLCSIGQLPSEIACEKGQIFSTIANDCVDYRPFDCALDAGGQTGAFADPFSCRKFYLCSGGQGTPNTCPENQYFDVVSRQCLANDPIICVDETCTPCTSESDVFTSSTECDSPNYMQCTSNSTVEGGFTLVNKTCPNEFCFDPVTFVCKKATRSKNIWKLDHKKGVFKAH